MSAALRQVVKRRWQRPVAPVEFPPQLRARLDRTGGGNLADRFAREEIFASYRPKLAIALAEDHMAVAGDVRRSYYEPPPPGKCPDQGRWRNSWVDALGHTRGQHRELQKAQLSKAFDEQQVRTFAENYAGLCAGMKSLQKRVDFARSCGVEPPAGRTMTPAGVALRLADPMWWRRQLRASWNRRAENVFRGAGIVRRGREAYASDDAVMARTTQKARCRQFMEGHAATNEQGEQLQLLELAEKSLANPALRRGEFMCRVRGFEEHSLAAGDAAQFWTLTTPSAFHAWKADGEKNPLFREFTVRDGQAWLCKQWSRVRAKLKRLSIRIYGFRIAEPHHDGTPHWHLLIFCRPHDAAIVEKVIRDYWLAEYKDEPGAAEFRVKCKAIDPEQGSAGGYIAKYVSKNIDGAGAVGEELDEETTRPVSEGLRRVDAWASLHRIRQFQQIGGPPVGLWRELRRMREPVDKPQVEAVRRPASDVSSWSEFITELGGLDRATRRVGCVVERYSRRLTRIPNVLAPRLAKRQWRKKMGPRIAWEMRPATPAEMPAAWLDRAAPRAVDREGRVVLCATKYGETPGDRAAGVVSFGLLGMFRSIATRPHRWRIQKCLTLNRSGVMNPPRSAAQGREARNAIALNAAGDDMAVGVPPAGTYPGEESGGAGPALSGSFFRSGSGFFSALGPVAITVRESNFVPSPALAWIATVPYRQPRTSSGAAWKTGPPK